jgi:hypothetical protein
MPKQADADPLQKISARPASNRNWRPQTLAQRRQADLKAPLTPLLVALLLATGCTAKVEVSHETTAAAQADSEPTEPPAIEQHRTAVEVDLFGQRESEPGAPQVPCQNPPTTRKPVPVNKSGIQVNGDKNTIEFHYHRHRRRRFPVTVYPVVRHEMVIVPGDGSAPVVFMDNAPPRIVVSDKELARAYANHMLRIAQQEGCR